jgi:hypothetical protein
MWAWSETSFKPPSRPSPKCCTSDLAKRRNTKYLLLLEASPCLDHLIRSWLYPMAQMVVEASTNSTSDKCMQHPSPRALRVAMKPGQRPRASRSFILYRFIAIKAMYASQCKQECSCHHGTIIYISTLVLSTISDTT